MTKLKKSLKPRRISLLWDKSALYLIEWWQKEFLLDLNQQGSNFTWEIIFER